jgi:exopolysaccharide biosynthesis polyprenyl glycosylphosphotransferase
MKKAELFFNVARLPVDAAMLIGAGIMTYLLRTRILDAYRPVLFSFNLPFLKFFTLVLFVAAIALMCYALVGLYAMKARMTIAREFARVVIGSSSAILVVILYIFLRQELFNSRFLVLGGWVLAMTFVFAGRLAIRAVQGYAVTRHNFGIQRVLVVGNDTVSQKVVNEIHAHPSLGYRLIAHLPHLDLPTVAGIVGSPGVDEIILANPNCVGDDVVRLVDFCHEHHIIFKFVPNVYQTLTKHYDVDAVNHIPVIELRRTSLDGWGKVAKRVVDIVAAATGLLVCAPLFVGMAIAIKIETAGPIVVHLPRISRNRRFGLLKFRGMVAHDPDGSAESLKAELASFNERTDGPLFKMRDDPRLTHVGKFIRRFRLDELAQFWNILKGEMSLVGPRPHQPDEIARYEKHHRKVLAIKAGATGLAQVSGSSDLPFDQEVVLDSWYIENWSLWLDIKIIAKTVLKMLVDRSAV